MTARFRSATLTCGLALGLLWPAPSDAQHTEPPPPAAYALEGVTLVAADGSRAEDVTVVVRGAFVEAADSGAAVPADARVLEGGNLHVYPGLVDAWGRARVELPTPPDPEEVRSWDAPRDARGFTPHRRIADHLVATGASLRERRAAGVVASGVFPRGGFAAGLGAVLLHRPDAELPQDLVVHPEAGLSLSFQGSPDAYPSTLFGVVAHLRQSFSDARRLQMLEREHGASPNRLTIPPWDPDLEVLQRVAGAGLPAFFQASEAEDVRRVLGLASELGFSPVIVGGGEAWREAETLAALGVPVLVSLDFPEPRHWDPDADPDDPADLEPEAARERERLVNLYANAGRLVEAGVTVALTSGGGEVDLREGARRTIEHGLPEEAALEALTSAPAGLLGIESLSRVVPGWSATFVVTDGPLFAEESRIVYTFVEGRLEEAPEDEDEPDDREAPAVDVTGRWTLVVEAGGERTEYELTLEQEGARVTGTARTPDGPAARIRRGVVRGDELELDIVLETEPEPAEARATATVEGDRMEGSGSGDMGDFEFTATRDPGRGLP